MEVRRGERGEYRTLFAIFGSYENRSFSRNKIKIETFFFFLIKSYWVSVNSAKKQSLC